MRRARTFSYKAYEILGLVFQVFLWTKLRTTSTTDMLNLSSPPTAKCFGSNRKPCINFGHHLFRGGFSFCITSDSILCGPQPKEYLMGHYSIVVIAHDEFDKLRNPTFGENLRNAILAFRGNPRDGAVTIQHSDVAKVVSSFRDDTPPTLLIADGWRCIDINRQDIPDDLKRYLKSTVKNIL